MRNNKILGTVSFHHFEQYRNEWLARDASWDKAENVVDFVNSVRAASSQSPHG